MRKVKASCFLLLIVSRAAVARSSGDCQEDRIQILLHPNKNANYLTEISKGKGNPCTHCYSTMDVLRSFDFSFYIAPVRPVGHSLQMKLSTTHFIIYIYLLLSSHLSYRLFRTGPVGPPLVSDWWGTYSTKFISSHSSLTWYFSKGICLCGGINP